MSRITVPASQRSKAVKQSITEAGKLSNRTTQGQGINPGAFGLPVQTPVFPVRAPCLIAISSSQVQLPKHTLGGKVKWLK